MFPHKGARKTTTFASFTQFNHRIEAAEDIVSLNLAKAKEIVAAAEVSPATKVTFRIDYLPKPLDRA